VNGNQKFDLEERLLAFSVRIIKIAEQLPAKRTGNHNSTLTAS
jgi:hypothetical protein